MHSLTLWCILKNERTVYSWPSREHCLSLPCKYHEREIMHLLRVFHKVCYSTFPVWLSIFSVSSNSYILCKVTMHSLMLWCILKHERTVYSWPSREHCLSLPCQIHAFICLNLLEITAPMEQFNSTHTSAIATGTWVEKDVLVFREEKGVVCWLQLYKQWVKT